MDLPRDPDELRSMLEQAASTFEAAIAGARERRRAVLVEFAELLARQATELRDCGEPALASDASALAASVERELADLERELAGVERELAVVERERAVVEPERALVERDLTAEPAPDHAGASEREPASQPDLPASEPAGAEPHPAEEPGDAPAPPEATAPDETALVASEIASIANGAHELDLMCWRGGTDADEIEARIALLALRARALQERHAWLQQGGCREARMLHESFGIMTRLSREHLLPVGLYVPYLRRDHRADWEAEMAPWQRRLDRLARRKAEAAAQAEAERRHLAAEKERERVRALVFREIEDVITSASVDPLWEFDFLDAVREALSCADAHDERLLDLVAPHARLLATGGEFRPLRRQLKKREGAAGAPAGAGIEEPPAPALPPPAHPFAHYQGAFRGQRAAIVGASCREHRRLALREFFGFDDLEWHENERTEGGDGAVIARRIDHGSYDVVFLLADFSSHSLQDHVKDACKRSGVPFVLVRHGYGIVAFGRALADAGRLVHVDG